MEALHCMSGFSIFGIGIDISAHHYSLGYASTLYSIGGIKANSHLDVIVVNWGLHHFEGGIKLNNVLLNVDIVELAQNCVITKFPVWW